MLLYHLHLKDFRSGIFRKQFMPQFLANNFDDQLSKIELCNIRNILMYPLWH